MPVTSPPDLQQLITNAVKNQPFVFVIMPFGTKSWLFDLIARTVREFGGLDCKRADDIPGAGFNLLSKVHSAIERCELVIAEISQVNPNVFYELGYAAGIRKHILVVAERDAAIPTDLKGLEIILYSEDRAGLDTFSADLAFHLRQRVLTETALLRDMLLPERPRPVYILASPRNPGPESKVAGHTRERRTFGDNLGIVRLLSAFGMIFGDTSSVELVSAQYYAEELKTMDINLCLIGSKKANPLAGEMLDRLQEGSDLQWRFGAAHWGTEEGDYKVSLFRRKGGAEYEVHGSMALWRDEVVHVEDHGLIIRGPHPDPKCKGRMVTIMAGAHSLGSAAACYAATHSDKIREIAAAGVDVARRDQTFWALLLGSAIPKDGLLDLESVTVLKAGVYEYQSNAQAADNSRTDSSAKRVRLI